MNLPANCNDTLCYSQVGEKQKGICPSGWHIPSNMDWSNLARYVDGKSGTDSTYYSGTAGKFLKTIDGWYKSTESSKYNNEDTYGFSALPAAFCWDNGCITVGLEGDWLSSTEYDAYDIYYFEMYDDHVARSSRHGDKYYLRGVRCVYDVAEPIIPSPSTCDFTCAQQVAGSMGSNLQSSAFCNAVAQCGTTCKNNYSWCI